MKFGENEIFSAIHPKILLSFFEKSKNKNVQKLAELFSSSLNNLSDKKVFFSRSELLKLLKEMISVNQEQWLLFEKELHNGTYAALAYSELRNSGVHQLDANTTSFSELTFKGKPIETLSFPILFEALKKIANHILLPAVEKVYEKYKK